jgi:molecular chaperone DnaJ
LSQGFFSVRQTCPTCNGAGSVIENPCPKCHGEGRVRIEKEIQVNIPPGVDTGSRLRVAGSGEGGLRGGRTGDLYIVMHVKPHDVFQRDDNDIFCEVPIDFPTAALGGVIEVPTITGKTKLKVPAGTQNGTIMRIKGKGVPSLRGSSRGDQHIKIIVEVPVKLSSKQQELLKEYAEEGKKGSTNHPMIDAFLNKAKKFFQVL